MFDILGAYNGKPPSPGKGGFPFSGILGGPCDFGNRWDCADVPALGPCAMLGRLGTTPKRWGKGPGRLGNSLGLPRDAGAGALGDVGSPLDYSGGGN